MAYANWRLEGEWIKNCSVFEVAHVDAYCCFFGRG